MLTPTARRALGPILLGAALVVFGAESCEIPPHYDDAYISYRYAANWVAGHGLVFNPGEYVEGFSNPLWTLLLAAGLALGAGARETAHVLGVASGALTLVASYAWAKAGLPASRTGWAGVAAWIVLASSAFARWSIAGMETPLFAATVTAAFAAGAWGRLGLATAFALLAALTRPEGPLVALALFGVPFLASGLHEPKLWRHAGVYAGLLGIALAIRLAYYGELLPNTFHAKVGGVSLSLSSLLGSVFLLDNAGVLVLPGLVAAMREPRWRPGAAFVLAMGIYGFAIGSVGRYLVPLVPCFAVLGVAGVEMLWRGGLPARIAGASALILAVGLSFVGLQGLRDDGGQGLLARSVRIGGVARARRDDANAERLGERRARILLERGERDVLVATGAIGSFGFHSQLRILDILGLVDRTIARSRHRAGESVGALPGHQRSDADHVFSREPDYLLIGERGRASAFRGLVPAPDRLRAHPELDRHYAWDPVLVGYRRVR